MKTAKDIKSGNIKMKKKKSKERYRIFLKGMEITELIDDIEIDDSLNPTASPSLSWSPSESPAKPVGIHVSGDEPKDKEFQYATIKIKNVGVHEVRENCIFLSYLPNNEFLNEMIKIKLRRNIK